MCAKLIWDGAAKGPVCHRASTWLQMLQDGVATLLTFRGAMRPLHKHVTLKIGPPTRQRGPMRYELD